MRYVLRPAAAAAAAAREVSAKHWSRLRTGQMAPRCRGSAGWLHRGCQHEVQRGDDNYGARRHWPHVTREGGGAWQDGRGRRRGPLTSKRGRGGEVRCLLHEAIVELWRRRSGVVVTGIRWRRRESLRVWCCRGDWHRLLGLACAGSVKLVRIIGTLAVRLLLLRLLLRGERTRVERGLIV